MIDLWFGVTQNSVKRKVERAACMLRECGDLLEGNPSAWKQVETEKAKEIARRRLNYIEMIRMDLELLRKIVISYIEDHDGKVPEFDTKAFPIELEQTFGIEDVYIKERIREFYEREWDYYIPADIVGKKYKDLQPNQPFIKIRGEPKYSKWWIDVLGRVLCWEENN
ncbi:MAG TPA: hypothetical protein VNK96_04300 [Fimbriimonadales bacterium]|nr:hypothetical protein [Fimbriimonadales bacterium]